MTSSAGNEAPKRDSKAADDTPPPARSKLLATAVVLGPAAVTLAWCLRHDPIERIESHTGRLVLSLLAIALLIATLSLRGRGYGIDWSKKLFTAREKLEPAKQVVGQLVIGAWFAAATYGVFNYYQFDRVVFLTPGDYADATYYYLNSKYFDELGYYRLYEALLVADEEGEQLFRGIRRYRDLQSYHRILPRSRAIERSDEVKSHFSEERWEAFSHDVQYLTTQVRHRWWPYIFTDHGYNPPPTWTFVGGALSSMVPVEYISWLTMLDLLLIIIMFVVIAWTFGLPTMLMCLLFFLATFSGRWPILGQAILRFDWLVALVIGICMLKRGKHGIAGGMLTYAMLNRVFPGIFGFPYVVWMVIEAIRARRAGERMISKDHIRFVIGAVLTVVVVVGGAFLYVGSEAFVDSAHNLRMHAGPDSYSSQRIGLGDALVYRGEWSRREMRENGGTRGKGQQLEELQTLIKGLGLLSLVFIGWVAWRSKWPPWKLIWLAFIPLYVLTNPQANYYNVRLVLVLTHAVLLSRSRGHLIALCGLFAVEVISHLVMLQDTPRYTVTSITSIALVIYVVGIIALTVRETLATPKQTANSGKTSSKNEKKEKETERDEE